MYSYEFLNKKNIEIFKEILKEDSNYEIVNKIFQEEYRKFNFISRIFYNKQIILSKLNENYVGYFYVKKIKRKQYIINGMYSKIKSYNVFNGFMNKFPKGSIFQVEGSFDEEYRNFLEALGFKEEQRFLQMEKSNIEKYDIKLDDNLKIKFFQLGKDEEIRCNLQNKIFKSKKRTEIDINDIIFEEKQQYFLEKGCIFLLKEDKFIGYGQLILEDDKVYIVNFGIVKEFREKGYGRKLLKCLVNLAEEFNFDTIYLKCNSYNKGAIKLYEELDFKIKGEFSYYKFK